MSDHHSRFSTPAVLAKMEKIDAFMAQRETATIAEISAHVGLSVSVMYEYLRHMSNEKRLHCCQRASNYQSGSRPALWKAGPAPDESKYDADDCMPRQVTVRQSWADAVPAMFEPMAYLFGRAA